MVNKKILVGGLVVIILILAVALIKSNKKIGPAEVDPAIPDGAGQNGSLIKDGPAIPDGGNEIKNKIKKEEVQEKIIISLPYAPSQPTSSIVPMGETIFHPKPQNPEGHPGIDFQWNLGKPIDIIACINGKIIQGGKVSLGQRIGEPGKFNGNHYNMHWELRLGTERICPVRQSFALR